MLAGLMTVFSRFIFAIAGMMAAMAVGMLVIPGLDGGRSPSCFDAARGLARRTMPQMHRRPTHHLSDIECQNGGGEKLTAQAHVGRSTRRFSNTRVRPGNDTPSILHTNGVVNGFRFKCCGYALIAESTSETLEARPTSNGARRCTISKRRKLAI